MSSIKQIGTIGKVLGPNIHTIVAFNLASFFSSLHFTFKCSFPYQVGCNKNKDSETHMCQGKCSTQTEVFLVILTSTTTERKTDREWERRHHRRRQVCFGKTHGQPAGKAQVDEGTHGQTLSPYIQEYLKEHEAIYSQQ